MKFRDQVIFDIGEEKFKYLHREDKNTNRVDIVELNKRLNETKKINLYINIKIILVSLSLVSIIALISLNF
jgi:hypothetical protein